MNSSCFVFILFLSIVQTFTAEQASILEVPFEASTPFSAALESLQTQINYTFKNDGLLHRAMTHASFSGENNKALSILGQSVIETSVSLQSLIRDSDISAKDLNLKISEVSKVDGSCTKYGTRLGLQKIVRVSHKTDATAPSVVCGAFRAIFGAISVDAKSSDEAVRVYKRLAGDVGSVGIM